MIIENLINGLIDPFLALIKALPTIELFIPADIAVKFFKLLAMLKLFIPFNTVVNILLAKFAITNWRMGWNVIQRIWDALPLT